MQSRAGGPRPAPNIIAAFGAAHGPHHPPPIARGPDPGFATDTRAADDLIATMRLVKSARFNAAERLAKKQTASIVTQSIVALYFIGLSVFQAVYAAGIDQQTQKLYVFISIVSSVFTLILGLLEALNDYQVKAHHLHNCALSISEISHELKIMRPANPLAVQEFRRRYNEALKVCPVNHSRIDFLCAKLDAGGPGLASAALQTRFLLDVYGLYAVFLIVPPLLWLVHQ